MGHSFIAYIDESGDDALNPANYRQVGRQGGSSHWLIISACVMRYPWHKHTVAWRDEILRLVGKQSRRLHFIDLSHAQRVAAVQYLVKKPVRTIAVLSNKHTIQPNTFPEKNQYYWYLTRYVIERLSWMCRSHYRNGEGDGRAKIIFSRRGRMSYEEFQNYLLHLKQNIQTSIYWDAIDIASVEALDHSKLAALQLADVAASAMALALEADEFGNCECRYAECLKPAVYRYNKNYLSYGAKIVPNTEMQMLSDQQKKFIQLFS